jgi:hypothetical protein
MSGLKVAIIGNCQAQVLEKIFSLAVPNITVLPLPPNFQMRETNREMALATLDEADFVFSQRVNDDFHLPWLTRAFLSHKYQGKVSVWPVLYFDGYFPNIQYVYLNGYGKLQGPLDDYHYSNIITAFKNKRSVEDVVAEILDVSAGGQLHSFRNSLSRIESREKDVDVRISDYLASVVFEKRSFYTPNHPYNFVLVEMARRLAAFANVAFDQDRAESNTYILNKVFIPVDRSVFAAESLAFNESDIYIGREVTRITATAIELGATKNYTLIDLVTAFYRVYETALQCH